MSSPEKDGFFSSDNVSLSFCGIESVAQQTIASSRSKKLALDSAARPFTVGNLVKINIASISNNEIMRFIKDTSYGESARWKQSIEARISYALLFLNQLIDTAIERNHFFRHSTVFQQ